MPTITFNAFASLQKKLKKNNIACTNAVMEIHSDLTARAFLAQMGFNETHVEAILINGKSIPLDTIIKEGDRVAFVPAFSTGKNFMSNLKIR
jgi:sulfur carrier protein ThiS